MAGTTTPRGRLRRLAELRPEHGRVLSVFFDLDPSTFATGAARASQITSVLDRAGREVDSADVDHDTRAALREDVERVRALLAPQTMAAGGARGLAVFACGTADVLEVVRTPHPVESDVVIGERPHIEPLAVAGERERWCVVLVDRETSRILLGDEDGLEELAHDDRRVRAMTEGRQENADREETRDQLDHVGDRLLTLLRRRPFDVLVVGAPEPLDAELEGRLHAYLRERLAGRVHVDVQSSGPDDVLRAAAPVFEARRAEHQRGALDRLRAGIGREDGRAVAGLAATLDALNQQRVEVLLLAARVSGPGYEDPATGYLTTEEGDSPSGEPLRAHEDVIEAAIERAVEQSAEVLVLDPDEHPDLGPHGGVAALLRF